MAKKCDVEVVINGRRFNIQGEEGVEYLKRVADYLEAKQTEVNKKSNNNIINDSEKNILMMINLADDYIKMCDKYDKLKAAYDIKQKEVDFVRRDLNLLKEKVKNPDFDQQRKIIKL